MTLAHPIALGFALLCVVGMLADRRSAVEIVGGGVMCVAMADGMVAGAPGLLPVAWSGLLAGVGIGSAVVSRITGRGAEALGFRLSLILCAALVLAVDGHGSAAEHHGGASLATVAAFAAVGQLVVSWREIAGVVRRRSRGWQKAMIAPLAMIGSAAAMGCATLGR